MLHINKKIIFSAILLYGLVNVSGRKPSENNNTVFRSFTLYEQNLLQARKDIQKSDSLKRELLGLYNKANKMLLESDVAVTQKSAEALAYVNGNLHEYCSLSKYFWPDSTDSSKPWIRKDGQTNEAGVLKFDSRRMYKMSDRVWTLTLAWWFSGKPEYARAAVSQLRVWYLNETSKMNPNMEFAQFVPNDPVLGRGAYYGIIEANSFPNVLNAVGMLESSAFWEKSDDKALKIWFSQFSDWLQHSEKGIKESQMTNNHGVYYDILLSSCLLYIGNIDEAKSILSKVQYNRMAIQIKADGSMPHELARANPWGYTAMNLKGFVTLCILGDKVGLNLWNNIDSQVPGLEKAITFVNQHISGTKKWQYQEKINISDIYEVYLYTSNKYAGSDEMLNRFTALDKKNFFTHLLYGGFHK